MCALSNHFVRTYTSPNTLSSSAKHLFTICAYKNITYAEREEELGACADAQAALRGTGRRGRRRGHTAVACSLARLSACLILVFCATGNAGLLVPLIFLVFVTLTPAPTPAHRHACIYLLSGKRKRSSRCVLIDV